MENITNADYMHAKRICRDFKKRNLGDHYDILLLHCCYILHHTDTLYKVIHYC